MAYRLFDSTASIDQNQKSKTKKSNKENHVEFGDIQTVSAEKPVQSQSSTTSNYSTDRHRLFTSKFFAPQDVEENIEEEETEIRNEELRLAQQKLVASSIQRQKAKRGKKSSEDSNATSGQASGKAKEYKATGDKRLDSLKEAANSILEAISLRKGFNKVNSCIFY